jgi:outer membrane protein OmpA-like peptidoglycan-associated protein
MDIDDMFRAIEKPPMKDNQDKSSQDGAIDWNKIAAKRREVSQPKKELAERERIANPIDGIGCPFGKVPDRQSIQDAIKRLSPEKQALLQNPRAVVYITGTASLVGDKEYNDRLSQQRAEAVADVFRSDPQVKARIAEPVGLGFDPAIDNGATLNNDNPKDRVVLIDIGLEGEKKLEKTKHVPENTEPIPEKKEASDNDRTEIPREFTHDYQMSRESAEGIFSRAFDLVIRAPKNPWSIAGDLVIEPFRQMEDASRYRKDMEGARSADEKLWGIRPIRGFLLDIQKPSEQWKVKSWLQEGGYDVDRMFKEYKIHWIRKGVI